MNKAALPYIGQKALLRKKWISTKRSNQCSKQHQSQKLVIEKIVGSNKSKIDLSNTNCSDIFKEIVNLTIEYSTTGGAPRYSNKLKVYAYTLYCLCPAAYRAIKKDFRLPSERCLRKSFETKIKKIEKNITNLNAVKLSIPLNYFYFKFIIPCTLIVDAFSISAITPFNKVKYTDKTKNNCFLFLIAPHMPQYPIFPIFLYESDSDTSDSYTQFCIESIINQFKDTRFQIKYTSVDGDPGYSERFNQHFQKILNDIINSDEEKAFKKIEEIFGFQIGDFLHFLKNGRSKILNKKIVINPETTDDFMDFILLLQDKIIFNYIRDTSTLAKMRDEYAINLFNFQTALYIYMKYSATTFIYFLIYSLWCESILNPHFSNQTRIYFLKIVYEFFKSIYLKYDHFKFNSKVKVKSGDPDSFVFFCPKHKIQRILNTLLVTIYEIKNSKTIIGIYRLGSHCIENFIGRIRMLCRHDNRFQTVLHNLARYEFIMHQCFSNHFVFNRKHSNPGGVSTRIDGSTFNEEYNPKDIVNELLSLIKLENPQNDKILPTFLKNLELFSTKNTFKKLKIPQSLRSIGITNRIFQQTPQKVEKEWNQEETEIIQQFLRANKQKSLNKLIKKFNCTKFDLDKKVQYEKEMLSHRPWSYEEDQMILKNINGFLSLKDLRRSLICRSNDQITSRKNEIKKSKYFYTNVQSIPVLLSKI